MLGYPISVVLVLNVQTPRPAQTYRVSNTERTGRGPAILLPQPQGKPVIEKQRFTTRENTYCAIWNPQRLHGLCSRRHRSGQRASSPHSMGLRAARANGHLWSFLRFPVRFGTSGLLSHKTLMKGDLPCEVGSQR